MKRLLFILSICLFVFTCVDYTQAKTTVCYVDYDPRFNKGKVGKNNDRYDGLNFAYEELKTKNSLKINLKFLKSNYHTSLIENLDLAKKEECHVLTGFNTSKESLIVGPWLKENKLIGISPTATAGQIQNYYPYLLTNMAKDTSYASSVESFLIKKDIKHIYIIENKESIYSTTFSKLYKNNLSKKFNIQFINAKAGSELDSLLVQKIISTSNVAVLFTEYMHYSLPIIHQFKTKKLFINRNKVLIIGSPEWPISDSYKIHSDYFNDFCCSVAPIIWSHEIADDRDFVRNFKNKYKRLPLPKVAFSYDIIMRVNSCSTNKNEFDQEKFHECLLKTKKIDGIVGEYTFSNGSSHPKVKIRMINLVKHEL